MAVGIWQLAKRAFAKCQIPIANCRFGFTLIELMVSMSIFAVITGFVLVNFRQGSRTDEVRFAAQTAASVIRDAMTRGTAGATALACVAGGAVNGVCTGEPPACAGGVCVSTVPKGWGVAFGTDAPEDSIVLFADVNGNKTYDAGEEVATERYSASGFVTVTAASPIATRSTILFVPPVPDVLVNGGTAADEAVFTLTHGAGGGARTVRFNRISRRIEITNP